jgi:hypothetical protein
MGMLKNLIEKVGANHHTDDLLGMILAIHIPHIYVYIYTWWLIPLSKWVITPVINGISRVNPLITGVITHLISGMSHQVYNLTHTPS